MLTRKINKNHSRTNYSTPCRRRRRHKFTWVAVILVALGVSFASTIIYSEANNQENNTSTDDKVSESPSDIVSTENHLSQEDNPSNNLSGELDLLDKDKTPPQYENYNPDNKDLLTGSISYIDINNNQLSVRINIDQFLENGTCTLRLLQGPNYYEYKVDIMSSVSTATCHGFDIDTTNIPNGDYDVYIELDSNDKKGIINGKVTL